MKNSNYLLVLALAASTLHGAAQAADVGVSVSISEPGFYGRIDIGRAPAPVLIYPQPVIIEQRPVVVPRQPIYLRVPPGHEKHWDKHCARYNACGQPVYFVQDNWYREVYVPRVNERGDRGNERGDRGNNRGDNGHGDHQKRKHEHGDN